MNKIYPCVVGLGYVGLPLFLKLSKKFKSIGFDKNNFLIKSLIKGVDYNNEFNKKSINFKKKSKVTSNSKLLNKCNFFIIAVPTPVNKKFQPDLTMLKNAVNLVGNKVKKNDIIFIEFTIYPSVTEKICIPILEKKSGLKADKDFFVGYSPERINPGDKVHSLEKIPKVVAFSSNQNEAIKKVKTVYKFISKKIIYSKNIKEAETSKVIENIQRDLNIALMNEIFIICEKLNINFKEVVRLASSKWNFHNYSPGLVGGHCLPVDPYYFSYIANKKKYKANVILAGRKINNYMETYITKKIIKLTKINSKNIKILLFGATYKPNVADIRNSIPLSIFKFLKKKYSKKVFCMDSCIDKKNAKKHGIMKKNNNIKYDYFIPLVKHDNYKLIYNEIIKKNKKAKLINLLN